MSGAGSARPCPRCTFPLEAKVHGAVVVDRCPRCTGTFLESGEAGEAFGPGHDAREIVQRAERGGLSKLSCPLGHGRLAAYRVGIGADAVEVDVCGHCSGLWLDAWEGVKLKRAIASLPVHEAETLIPGEAPVEKTGAGWYLFQLFSGLPVEVWNPVRARAHLVNVLLAANLVVFVVEVLSLAGGGDWFIRTFGLVPAALLDGGQPWSLVTHMFLHAGVVHLLGNLYFLYVFGDNVEDTLGRKRFLQLYFVSGLVAAIAQTASNPSSAIPLVGASGAISGLMGAYLVLFPRVKVWVVWFFVRFKLGVVWYLALWLAFQTLAALVDLNLPGRAERGGVAFFAHIGGFVAGVALGLLLRRRR